MSQQTQTVPRPTAPAGAPTPPPEEKPNSVWDDIVTDVKEVEIAVKTVVESIPEAVKGLVRRAFDSKKGLVVPLPAGEGLDKVRATFQEAGRVQTPPSTVRVKAVQADGKALVKDADPKVATHVLITAGPKVVQNRTVKPDAAPVTPDVKSDASA